MWARIGSGFREMLYRLIRTSAHPSQCSVTRDNSKIEVSQVARVCAEGSRKESPPNRAAACTAAGLTSSVELEESADSGMWALGLWPRVADGLTEVAGVAERSNWQLDRGSSQGTETQSNIDKEREGEERGDTGRDVSGRVVQGKQKGAGPHSMVKMQKVGCEVW